MRWTAAIGAKSTILNPIGKGLYVMEDNEKKIEPVKPLTLDALRKMAASGKSIPSVKPAPPEERTK